MRKVNFGEQATYDYGVSLAKAIPPAHYGMNGYFEIHIPENHGLELIDISQSPRHASNMTSYIKNLQEVNSVQAIPREYIYAFYPSSGGLYKNPYYGQPKQPKPVMHEKLHGMKVM